MILLIGGVKGGISKTTLATNFSVMRMINNKKSSFNKENGEKLMLIDADTSFPAASMWCSVRDDLIDPKFRICNVQKFGRAIKNELLSMRETYSDIIVDCRGVDDLELSASLVVADKVIFPLYPSSYSNWTLKKILNFVDQASVINPKLKSYLCLAKAYTNPKINLIENTIEFINKFREDHVDDKTQLKLIETVFYDRIIVEHSNGRGLSVVEYDKSSQSAKELTDIYKEIFDEE